MRKYVNWKCTRITSLILFNIISMFNTPCTVCSFFRVERYTTELQFDSIYENDITFCIVTSLMMNYILFDQSKGNWSQICPILITCILLWVKHSLRYSLFRKEDIFSRVKLNMEIVLSSFWRKLEEDFTPFEKNTLTMFTLGEEE